jgi:hypothetical protein
MVISRLSSRFVGMSKTGKRAAETFRIMRFGPR